MINVFVNGIEVNIEDNKTILDACRAAGVDVPTLCQDDRLKGEGSCRICMVSVGGKKLVPACATAAAAGMKVETHSDKIVALRKQLLELILSDHNTNCLTCEKTGGCKLQDYAYEYGVDIEKYQGRKKDAGYVASNKFFYLDQSKCIMCTKCARVCNQLQTNKVWSVLDRGFETQINTPFGIDMEEGNCVSVCPVGALMPKKKEGYRTWEVEKTQTTCPYCGVGCQMNLLTKGNKIVGVEPVMDSLNNGLLCVKGKFGYHFVNHPDRLTDPLIKKNGVFEKVTWEEAYGYIREKMNQVKEKYGTDNEALNERFGFFGSAKVTVEENYLVQKFARAVIGSNSVDCCARL